MSELVVHRVGELSASGVWTYSVSALPRDVVVSGVAELKWLEVSGYVSASLWTGDVWANFILRRVDGAEAEIGPGDGVPVVLASGFFSSFSEPRRSRVELGAQVNGTLVVRAASGSALSGLYATALLGSVSVSGAELRLAYTPAQGAPPPAGAGGVAVLSVPLVVVPLGLLAGAALALKGRR